MLGNSAVVGGAGRIGPILASEGSVRPGGASPGELTAGNIIAKPAATFLMRLAGPRPGVDYDRVRVIGTVNLGGAQLTVTPTFAPPPGQVFVLVDNDGTDAINGTFAGLPEGATLTLAGIRYAVSYRGGADSNDVTLSVQSPPPPCPEPVLSIRRLSNEIELSWPSCPSNFYRVAMSTNLRTWTWLTAPLAAPETNAVMTWLTPTSLPSQYYRLRVGPVPESLVPLN